MLLNAQSEFLGVPPGQGPLRVQGMKIERFIFLYQNLTAFIGYVLPFGQMSLWGATVITNLFSAIPWIGHDLVELTIYNLLILPPIGSVNKYASKNLRLDKNIYLSIPYYFLSFLIGIIDGDGYISITKTPKNYIRINLVLSLHLNDRVVLEYIKSVLNLGRLEVYPDYKSPTCKLIISKTDLQEILFPLLKKHELYFLTTTRSSQYNLAKYIIENNIVKYDDILNLKLDNKLNIDVPFFNNWLIGFTNAEGSFFMKSNGDGCFQLKHSIEKNLFEKIKSSLTKNICIEKDKYEVLSLSSKYDIQKVINFFSFAGHHPLIGQKYIRYQIWLKILKQDNRYKDLKFPSNIIGSQNL